MHITNVVRFKHRSRRGASKRGHGDTAQMDRVVAFKPTRVEAPATPAPATPFSRQALFLAVLGLPRDFQSLMFNKMPDFYAACGLDWPRGA